MSAPAGYGKSVLASSPTCKPARCPAPGFRWTNRTMICVFSWDYILTALDGLFAGSLRQTQALLTGPSLPPAAVIAHSLVNELAELEREFILVLDDIHVLRTTDIYDLLAALLRHPLPGFHLLLLTRQNLLLALGVLRAYDQLSEIRVDSRFTVGETAAFMDRAVALPLRDDLPCWQSGRKVGPWACGWRRCARTTRQRQADQDRRHDPGPERQRRQDHGRRDG